MPITIPKGKIAVTPLFDSDLTSSGRLYIPHTAKGRSDQGLVKYVGQDLVDEYTVGEYVMFSGYSGTLFEIEDELVLIIPAKFVVAKIPNPDNNVTEISGLYFRGKDGTYFQATYEIAMDIIRDSLAATPWYRKLNEHKLNPDWKPETPKIEEYNEKDD